MSELLKCFEVASQMKQRIVDFASGVVLQSLSPTMVNTMVRFTVYKFPLRVTFVAFSVLFSYSIYEIYFFVISTDAFTNLILMGLQNLANEGVAFSK